MTATPTTEWTTLCSKNDLIPNSGVAAMLNGKQVAVFYIPGFENEIYAISNNDPFSGSNVLSRGLIGDINGEPMVASPIYKQHFSLNSGQCFEDETVKLAVWPVKIDADSVMIQAA